MAQNKTDKVKELKLIAVQLTDGVIGQNWITSLDHQNCPAVGKTVDYKDHFSRFSSFVQTRLRSANKVQLNFNLNKAYVSFRRNTL